MEIDISDFEQLIYNTHLRISRQKKNLPFKYRKDFTHLNDVYINSIKKIAIFLAKFPHIKLDDFIKAPYEMYSDEIYFELDYYTTLKATKAYTLFMRRRESLDPDNEEQLNYIIESLKFISAFCKEQSINVADYIEHRTGNSSSYILHLKEHRVNVYSLFGFSNFEKNLRSQDSDIIKFILSENFLNMLSNFRLKFFASRKAKKLVELGIQKIKIQNTLD
jgi:hypothetical protein